MNRVIAWSPRGFRWHTDPKHAKIVCEAAGLKPGESLLKDVPILHDRRRRRPRPPYCSSCAEAGRVTTGVGICSDCQTCMCRACARRFANDWYCPSCVPDGMERCHLGVVLKFGEIAVHAIQWDVECQWCDEVRRWSGEKVPPGVRHRDCYLAALSEEGELREQARRMREEKDAARRAAGGKKGHADNP